jgi:hypothetical protein
VQDFFLQSGNRLHAFRMNLLPQAPLERRSLILSEIKPIAMQQPIEQQPHFGIFDQYVVGDIHALQGKSKS